MGDNIFLRRAVFFVFCSVVIVSVLYFIVSVLYFSRLSFTYQVHLVRTHIGARVLIVCSGAFLAQASLLASKCGIWYGIDVNILFCGCPCNGECIGVPLHRKRYLLTRILPGDAHGKSFKKTTRERWLKWFIRVNGIKGNRYINGNMIITMWKYMRKLTNSAYMILV